MQAATAGPDPQAVLLGILNGERRYNRLREVIGNPLMQREAEAQAMLLSVRQELVHLDPGKFNWWTNPSRPGHLWWAGEVIGYGEASDAGLLAVNHAWIRSPPHRAIMLDPRAALIGVGVREAAGRYWASAFFGG